MTARTLAAAALFALVGSALAQPPKAAPLPKDAKADRPDLHKQLTARVTVEKFDGKFKDAVQFLAEKYELPLVVDPRVGQDAEGAIACNADERPVKLAKLTNVRLDTVLNLLTEQVNAKFLVYPDHIKIVPTAFWLYESAVLQHDPLGLTQGDETPFLTPLDMQKTKPLTKRGVVNASFKNKPLNEIIDEIAEATGANVALAPLVPAQTRQGALTVRFTNVPVDAAVRTLCEMTELGVIEDANVLLVTTSERAAARAKEAAQKLKDRQPPPVPFAHGLGPVPPLPDVNADLLKLKEQNEQLRKELDDLKKLLKK